MPLLEAYAAKDPKTGAPCVTRIGPGGSGHFVKMVHNGIEGGMLSTLAEAWSYMHYGLGMDYEQIGDGQFGEIEFQPTEDVVYVKVNV